MILGFDFDNTLISYDRLFQKVALDKALVPADTPPQKNAVRDYLRHIDREDEWTRMQGDVYGSRILEAEPYPNVLQTLQTLAERQCNMCIVSHKTRVPYMGEPYDLHAAARSWLDKQGFFRQDGFGFGADRIFFELTKQEKIQRIVALGCTHYVDDLPEILAMLPASIERILFAPGDLPDNIQADWKLMRRWEELPALLDA